MLQDTNLQEEQPHDASKEEDGLEQTKTSDLLKKMGNANAEAMGFVIHNRKEEIEFASRMYATGKKMLASLHDDTPDHLRQKVVERTNAFRDQLVELGVDLDEL